ncbi:hypothetical protein OAL70_03765 [Pelagibacteraceae bacterium]|jgi:hypothetical protein|nr:hypothetical protein [Pelagibacteraceae bacterium]
MTGYLAFSIYSYIASLVSWRIEKLYKELNEKEEQKIKIFFLLKHGFRITGTILLIAHLLP